MVIGEGSPEKDEEFDRSIENSAEKRVKINPMRLPRNSGILSKKEPNSPSNKPSFIMSELMELWAEIYLNEKLEEEIVKMII